jgi:hypothetical protein
MTPFEQHMRRYHPDSTTARLSMENEHMRGIITRVSRVTYGSEAYPISEEDQDAMRVIEKEEEK